MATVEMNLKYLQELIQSKDPEKSAKMEEVVDALYVEVRDLASQQKRAQATKILKELRNLPEHNLALARARGRAEGFFDALCDFPHQALAAPLALMPMGSSQPDLQVQPILAPPEAVETRPAPIEPSPTSVIPSKPEAPGQWRTRTDDI